MKKTETEIQKSELEKVTSKEQAIRSQIAELQRQLNETQAEREQRERELQEAQRLKSLTEAERKRHELIETKADLRDKWSGQLKERAAELMRLCASCRDEYKRSGLSDTAYNAMLRVDVWPDLQRISNELGIAAPKLV